VICLANHAVLPNLATSKKYRISVWIVKSRPAVFGGLFDFWHHFEYKPAVCFRTSQKF
jgi:hypothetical protein